MNHLSSSITLPCGAVLKNRIAKSAMSENMANLDHSPSDALIQVYKTWGQSEAGLLLTGNVMVNAKCLGEPGNVVIEDEKHLKKLENWAQTVSLTDTHLWVQINHPGRQAMLEIGSELVAPSTVPLQVPGRKNATRATPRELTNDEIWEIVASFGETAAISKKAGFTGVQIHGAHGYLVNQFLSPHTNKRNDDWGGSLENRMKFLLEIYKSIREQVGSSYPIGVKLNSADFQKGGFSEEESMQVIQQLEKEGIDLIEISGGTYEAPAMMGNRKSSTKKREAYFIEFAEKVRQSCKVPLMVTGGFRTSEGMNEAIASGALDITGVARPYCVYPYLAKEILSGERRSFQVTVRKTGIKALDGLMNIVWFEAQIKRIGNNKPPKTNLSAWVALWTFVKDIRRYRRNR